MQVLRARHNFGMVTSSMPIFLGDWNDQNAALVFSRKMGKKSCDFDTDCVSIAASHRPYPSLRSAKQQQQILSLPQYQISNDEPSRMVYQIVPHLRLMR